MSDKKKCEKNGNHCWHWRTGQYPMTQVCCHCGKTKDDEHGPFKPRPPTPYWGNDRTAPDFLAPPWEITCDE